MSEAHKTNAERKEEYLCVAKYIMFAAIKHILTKIHFHKRAFLP